MKKSVFIATSLDGYIARADGNLDWLDKASLTVSKGEDCGYVSFMSSIDLLVMGRNSYEKVLSFGGWPYEKPVIVLSSRNLKIPEALKNQVYLSAETPEELCSRLANEGVKRIYVDGGAVIQSFLTADLITDLTITTIPILIGSGISLFGNIKNDIELERICTKTYDFGFVQNKYVIKHGGQNAQQGE